MSLSTCFAILYCIWVAAEIAVYARTYTRRSGGEVRDRGSLLLLWIVNSTCLWAGFTVAATHPHTMLGGAAWLNWLGLALFVVGLGIRLTAIVALGKSFSVNVAIHATQTLKRDGIFRYVRHPSYSGLVLIFLGIGVHTRNWEALFLMVVPHAIALLYRIHVEEQALSQAFGAQYADYSRTTKRLIPGIY